MKRMLLLSIITALLLGQYACAEDGGDGKFSSKEYKVRINQVIPGNGMPPRMDAIYYLKVKDGKLETYLPFIGTDEMPAYGGDPSIEVDGEMEDYSEEVEGKNLKIKFTCTDRNHLSWKVNITVYEGESFYATFHTSSRSLISFRGEVLSPDDSEAEE